MKRYEEIGEMNKKIQKQEAAGKVEKLNSEKQVAAIKFKDEEDDIKNKIRDAQAKLDSEMKKKKQAQCKMKKAIKLQEAEVKKIVDHTYEKQLKKGPNGKLLLYKSAAMI